MSKIQMVAVLYGKLMALCNQLRVEEDACEVATTMENLQSTQTLCHYLAEDVRTLADMAGEVEGALYEQDLSAAVGALSDFVDRFRELQGDMHTLRDYVQRSAVSFHHAVEPVGFAPLCTDEEMESVIAEHFQRDSVMSLGYKDGQYALIFGDGEQESEPYVFAVGSGDEDALARAYIERFIEVEEEGEE